MSSVATIKMLVCGTGILLGESSFYDSRAMISKSLFYVIDGRKLIVTIYSHLRYMQQGAEAVHAANPDVLVILSGLNFDLNLSFLFSKQVQLSFTGKLVFEQHWYSFSDGTDWAHQNQNDACGVAVESLRTNGLFLDQQGRPLFFSEIGFDMSGRNTGDERYVTCFLSIAAEMDLRSEEGRVGKECRL